MLYITGQQFNNALEEINKSFSQLQKQVEKLEKQVQEKNNGSKKTRPKAS